MDNEPFDNGLDLNFLTDWSNRFRIWGVGVLLVELFSDYESAEVVAGFSRW